MKKISGFIIAGLIAISAILKFVLICGMEDKLNDTFGSVLVLIVLLTEICALPAIIFYLDRNKNDSLIPIAGYISIGLYLISIIAYIVTLKSKKTASIEELKAIYESIKKITNFQEFSKNLITLFEYASIVNILHFKVLNSKAQLSKTLAFIAAFIFFVLSSILIWKTENTEKLQYSVSFTKDVYFIFLALFVTFQSFGDGELNVPVAETQQLNSGQTQEPSTSSSNQEPIFGNSASGKPKFRNPALEEQEARLAAQKAAQNQMNNQQVMPTMGLQQPPMSTTSNMMPQQPMTQPQPMTQQPMVQPQPMNQPPIDPAMGVPPITNQQYPQ